MAPRRTFPDADKALNGKLASLLREWREDGVSFSEIAFRIREATGGRITASGELVRQWCIAEGLHQVEEAS